MSEQQKFKWQPTPALIAQSTLTAFLKRVGEANYESLVARADADPAWLMEEVFAFCDFRFYKPYTQMLDTPRSIEWARWCVRMKMPVPTLLSSVVSSSICFDSIR